MLQLLGESIRPDGMLDTTILGQLYGIDTVELKKVLLLFFCLELWVRVVCVRAERETRQCCRRFVVFVVFECGCGWQSFVDMPENSAQELIGDLIALAVENNINRQSIGKLLRKFKIAAGWFGSFAVACSAACVRWLLWLCAWLAW